MEQRDKLWRRLERPLGIGIIALILFGCVWVLLPFVTALLWAAIICYATWPLYRRVERVVRGRRALAASVMTLLGAAVMLLPVAAVAITIVGSRNEIVEGLQNLQNGGLPMPPDWLASVPLLGPGADAYWRELSTNREALRETLSQAIEASRTGLVRLGFAVGQGLLQLTVSVLVAFFFYRDGDRIVGKIAELTSRALGDYSQHLLRVVGNTVRSVCFGILGTAMVQGLLAAIGFSLAGVPSPLLLGFLTFLLGVVPAGPAMVWIAVTLWLLASGETGRAVFMGLWGVLGISSVDNIVRPILISQGTVMPFALVFLGLLGGLWAFGFIGVFLGPTLLAIGYSLVQEFVRGGVARGAPLAPEGNAAEEGHAETPASARG